MWAISAFTVFVAIHHPALAARIAQLATEMQAGHMDRYSNQTEGTERYQQIIKGLVTTPASG